MTKMSVALAFLLALCTLIYNVHGGGKGFKTKGIDLKKKLVHKIFHHNHHHPYHHRYTHHPHHRHQHHHHYHYHYLPHHHHQHGGKNKHLNHHRHHHHHHHHHYHNPFKHHLHRHHRPHKKTFHRHPHKHPLHQHHHLHKQHQPLHQYHRLHKQHIQKHHKDVEHHHSNKRSGINHAPVPDKLQLHVQINDSQATKRQSLPDLLANLGQHLVKLGSNLSPKSSQMAVHDNTNNEGDVRNEVPEPKSSTVQSPTVQDSPVAAPALSLKKNVSVNEVEGLLHHALDAENSDEMESAFSGNGATEARNAAASNRTDGATAADRRNETFPEAEIYGRPLDDREYDASEQQRESANLTLEEIAGQSFETENTRPLDQTRNGQSNSGKENKPAVHEHDQSKNVALKTNVDDVDTNTVLEHEKIKEKSTQNDSPKLEVQSSSEKPKSSDMNSTLDDEGREIEKDTSKSGADESQKSVTGESDDEDFIDDERKKTEVSGSGEESFNDGNTEEQTVTDNKRSHESKSAEQEPSKPSQDEEANVAEEGIDQNRIGSADGQQVRERKGKPFINQTEDPLDEPTRPLSERNIDQQAVVNVAETQIMGNQSDDSFQSDSTEGADLKMEGSNLEKNKLINPPDSNDPEKTVSLDSRIKGSSIQDAKLRGDLDTLAVQHAFSVPENSVPATNSEKVLQTKNGGPNTPLDAINSNQSNEQDHPALNDIDKVSGTSNVGQELPQENEGTQDQDPHTDIVGFSEGPKTPAVLDEPAEPSSSSDTDPQVVNVESHQEGSLQEDTSQEPFPGDVADAIPVYTLSSPIGDDTFRGDENSLSTPTSLVTTSSVNFIDPGGNMSTGYSESPSSSEGYGTFTAPVEQSQEDVDSLSQGAVVQRDMLDDPVQESLETTVDSNSS